MKHAREIFYKHMKTAGIEFKPLGNPSEKVASAPSPADKLRDNFLDSAAKAIYAEVAANIYLDPVLGKLADVGDVKRVAHLAEGRYVDSAGASKLASMSGTEFMGLVEQGLRKKLNEKTAEAAKSQATAKTASLGTPLFKR